MAELKEGTLKITVTEAALKVLGEQHQVTLRYGKDLAQCDKCMVWMAQEEIGYRDQQPYVRTECRGCHEHDWRCQEDFGEDDLPEEGAPMDKVQAALETLQNSEPEFQHRTKVDIVQEYLSQEYQVRITPTESHADYLRHLRLKYQL